jgi:DNA-3-methyladenine glycosylase I
MTRPKTTKKNEGEKKEAKRKRPARCWGEGDDPRMTAYHDKEWGRPLHDERKIFEFLILEGMQAGLSWRTILYKRENFRKAFDVRPDRETSLFL